MLCALGIDCRGTLALGGWFSMPTVANNREGQSMNVLPWHEFAAPSPQRDGDGKFVDSVLIRKLSNFGPLSEQEKDILSA
jgi:hypothetical protein